MINMYNLTHVCHWSTVVWYVIDCCEVLFTAVWVLLCGGQGGVGGMLEEIDGCQKLME